jgi:hypothetical protein
MFCDKGNDVETHKTNGSRKVRWRPRSSITSSVCAGGTVMDLIRFPFFLLYARRNGVMHHKHSHIRVILREIDFKLKIYQANAMGQKKKWLLHQMRADRDAEKAKVQRDEMQRLVKEQDDEVQKRKAIENK